MGLRRLLRAVLAAGVVTGALASLPAAAQEARTNQGDGAQRMKPDPDAVCFVFARESELEPELPSRIMANCDGRGVDLGYASEFTQLHSKALEATLVDLVWGNDRRVLLLSLQEDGVPLVEDLSGQIAVTAGLGPMSQLEGVELDLAGFAKTGAIGVRGRPDAAGARQAGAIDLGRQIAAERSRRRGAADTGWP